MAKCVSCEESLTAATETLEDGQGSKYCETCWTDEGDGVYFCQRCDERLLLNVDDIHWQDEENYTDPLCADCAEGERQ